jgi:superfamily II DNA or RNA helicase
MFRKLADLLPNVQLQEHQQKLIEEAEQTPIRKLLLHSLGSGKTLSAIGMAEAHGQPYTAIVPASLRPTWRAEQQRFTDQRLPNQIMSYSQLARGTDVKYPGSAIFDEAHRLRNLTAKQTRQALDIARKAKQLVLLSGTPIINEPGDLAVPIHMLTGQKMDPKTFRERYVGEKPIYPNLLRRILRAPTDVEPIIKNKDELKALLKGYVDYYDPGKPIVPIKHEDIHIIMGPEQSKLYQAMWNKLPWHLRFRMKWDFPLSDKELQKARSFLIGPRQVGLSTYPYQRHKNPLKAFDQSPKLVKAQELLAEQLKDPRTKALVFSNFIDAGLIPYASGLQRAGIPHAIFHGGLSDSARRKLVDDYNAGRIRVALLGPSGTEGLSFKGTQLIQILDPYWNPARGKQSVGRGLRFGSHTDLPEELQNVKVQRFIARLPPGLKERILSRLGSDRPPVKSTDDYLRAAEVRKEKLNQLFMELLKEVGSRNVVKV